MSSELIDKLFDVNADHCLVSAGLEEIANILDQEDQDGRAFLIRAVIRELRRISEKLNDLEMDAKNFIRKPESGQT